MSYTNRQLNRILADNVLPAGVDLTLSQRVSEAVVRRKLYAWEDRAVNDMHALFVSTWADIRSASAQAAEMTGLTDKLTTVNGGSVWRDRMSAYINAQVDTLWRDVLRLTRERGDTAYLGGYTGAGYTLAVSTRADVRKPVIRLPSAQTVRSEAERDWQARYGDTLDVSLYAPFADFKRKARSALNTAGVNQETPAAGLKRVKEFYGLQTLKQLYYFSQLTMRTYILACASLGRLRLYAEYAGNGVQEAVSEYGILMGVITAGDGRVCPVCRDASRRMWAVSSLAGIVAAALTYPIPPIHFGCRCGTWLFVLPEWLLPPDVPPGLTFGEYLALLAIGDVLAAFNDGTLDSSQVGELEYM